MLALRREVDVNPPQGIGVPVTRSLALVAIPAFLLLFSGCQARPATVKPVLDTDGELFIYLSPLPPDADRLSFRLEGMSAVREDGGTVPLTLHLETGSREELARERFLASGPVPPGPYAGLMVKVRSASLRREDGEAALLVTEEPVRIAIPFPVARRRGTVLSLALRYAESVSAGFQFVPAFDVSVRGKLATGLDAFASSRGANTVTVFDKVSGRVSGVIPTGAAPAGMALDPGRRKLYVALSGDDAIQVIDVVQGEVVDRLKMIPGDSPLELALTPDGRTLLSVNSGSNTVSVIDPAAPVELARIAVGVEPRSLLVDRTGRRVYVFNAASGTVSVLDIPGRQVAATIATDAEPVRGDFSRDGSRLYVAHGSSPYLSVIDTSSLAVVKRIYVGIGAIALKVDSRTDQIYLYRRHVGQIEIFDAFSSLPVDFIRSDEEVAHLTIDGEGNNLLLVLPESNAIREIRLIGKGDAARLDVGEDPYRVTLMGER